MTAIVALASTCVCISLLYYVAAIIAASRFAHRAAQPAPSLPKIAPRLAVLKPLHGRPAGLAENLMSYLESDYPRTDFYFGVADYDDPAAAVPVTLRAQYKFAPITLVVGDEPGCANRKVAKLIRMAERAQRAEIFVLSDADVSVTRDHLRRIAGELAGDEQAGLVTCVYRGRPTGSFVSRLEALFVNTDFAPQVMLAAAIEPVRYAFGATIAIKRATLEAIGGFRRLKDLLADDYYLGKLAVDSGASVKLSSSIVTTACEGRHLRDLWQHQIRWARTYRTARPASLATILLHGPSWSLLLLIASGFSPAALAAAVAVLTGRIVMARFMIKRILGLSEFARDAWMVPFKDLLMTAIWLASLVGNEVEWAGRRLRILAGGKMREVA